MFIVIQTRTQNNPGHWPKRHSNIMVLFRKLVTRAGIVSSPRVVCRKLEEQRRWAFLQPSIYRLFIGFDNSVGLVQILKGTNPFVKKKENSLDDIKIRDVPVQLSFITLHHLQSHHQFLLPSNPFRPTDTVSPETNYSNHACPPPL